MAATGSWPPGSRARFDLTGYQLSPWCERPDLATLFTDRVGPWFDADGSEILLPCSEAFEQAVQDVIGRWTVRSNVAELDGRAVEIGFPELTLLAQHEWDRVTGGRGPLPRQAFLLQLGGAPVTTGRVCEQLIVGVFFDQLSEIAWPGCRLVDTIDAVDAGLLRHPTSGTRSDDVTLLGPVAPAAVVEVKASVKGWAAIRQPVRRSALRQLWATCDANPELVLDLVVITAAIRDRQLGVYRLPADRSQAGDVWRAAHTAWRPPGPPRRDPRIPRPDEHDDHHTRLAPGRHVDPGSGSGYTRVVKAGPIWVDPTTVGDLFAAGTGGIDDPLVAGLLCSAHDLLDSSPDLGLLLPWALGLVNACTPDAIGLVGTAAYSGTRSTSLVGNLAHRSRGVDFAAELIVAACLAYRGWPRPDGELGEVRYRDGRLDFGVKLVGTGTTRATAEADILLSYPDGVRHGVDVKHSRRGRFATVPAPAMLEVVAQALGRGELRSFHFVTNGRFSPAFVRAVGAIPGVYAHDRVWPTGEDVTRIGLQQLQRVDHGTILNGYVDDRYSHRDEICHRALDAYVDGYLLAFGSDRDLRFISIGGHEHLFDTTVAEREENPATRLVAIGGESTNESTLRDERFMRGFPLPAGPFDRGHLHASQAGGTEAIGMNLIPQDARPNRGQGRDGRRWRSLERSAAANPGTLVVTRAIYDDATDVPAWLEVCHVYRDGTAIFDRFPNRKGLP